MGSTLPDSGDPWAQMSDAERAVHELLQATHLAAAHELPALVAQHARTLGGADALIYLVDLQQNVLVPFQPPGVPGVPAVGAEPGDPHEPHPQPLGVDSTLAGRAFQLLQVLTQPAADGEVRVWLPLVDGTERLGVLRMTLDPALAEQIDGSLLVGIRLRRFASLVGELIMTKTLYGDTIVRLRRQAPMGVAAEMQWSLLPPLTFSCREVTVAAALEPAYEVAGDTVDYAVDAGCARAAVFDAMGHGLRSAQLAVVAVATYRNARRASCTLTETVTRIHEALLATASPTSFATAVVAELDTATGMFCWVNAGHPEPLLLRGGKMVKSLYAKPGLPLGLDIAGDAVDRTVTVGREQLEPGDQILLYTDGVTEARSPDGDFFGEQRLVDLVVRNLATGLPTPETMRRVVRALLAHQQGQLSDDATLLLLEWQSDSTSANVPQ